MTIIAGATRLLSAATLATQKGFSAQSASLLDNVGLDLLSVGRNNRVSGIGLSANSRALTQEILDKSSGLANGLFSATAGADATLEGLQTQVLAIRSQLSADRVAPSLRGDTLDTEA